MKKNVKIKTFTLPPFKQGSEVSSEKKLPRLEHIF